jgi:hypothetical protein
VVSLEVNVVKTTHIWEFHQQNAGKTLYINTAKRCSEKVGQFRKLISIATIKNDVFWDVTLCDSCKHRRFGGP